MQHPEGLNHDSKTPMQLGFSVRLTLVLARSTTISPRQARARLISALSQPFETRCCLPKCQRLHAYRIRITSHLQNDHWCVDPNSTPLITQEERRSVGRQDVGFQGISISSPVFQYFTSGWPPQTDEQSQSHAPFHSPGWQIEQMIRKCNEVGNNGDESILALYANEIGSLRVRIGDVRPWRGLKLETIKNALKFGVMFERQLDAAHSPGRFRRGPLDALRQFASVDAIHSWSRLMSMVSASQRTKTSIGLVRMRGHAQTLEFAQHAATMDVGEVVNWVHATAAITMGLDAMKPSKFNRYLFSKWCDLQHGFPQILQEIGNPGLRESVVEHYSHVISDKRHEDYAWLRSKKEMRAAEGHRLQSLFEHVARRRLEASNWNARLMAVTGKMLSGEYGWLPKGSPLRERFGALPVYDEEGKFTVRVVRKGRLHLPCGEEEKDGRYEKEATVTSSPRRE